MYEQDDSETLSGVTATYNPFTRTKQNTSMEYCIGSAIPSSMVKRCEKDWKVACKWTEKLFKLRCQRSNSSAKVNPEAKRKLRTWGWWTCLLGSISPIISSQRWAKASRGPSMTQFQIPTTLLDQLPWPWKIHHFDGIYQQRGDFQGRTVSFREGRNFGTK